MPRLDAKTAALVAAQLAHAYTVRASALQVHKLSRDKMMTVEEAYRHFLGHLNTMADEADRKAGASVIDLGEEP